MDNSEMTKDCTAPMAWRCLVAVSLAMSLHGASAAEYVPTFFDMDKDGDSLISTEEAGYWAVLLDNWSRLDTNQDGVIDLPEWEAVDIEALRRN